MVLKRSSLYLIVVLLAVLAAACTSQGDSEVIEAESVTVPPSTTRPESSSTSTTTTTTPLAASELLVLVLGDPLFAATVDASLTQTTPAGVISFEGAGAVDGVDSRLRLETDFSGLEAPVWDASGGGLVGPGEQTTRSQETRLVEDWNYRNNGERWVMRLREDDDDTTVGHVFSVISSAPTWREITVETIDGEDLHVLEPTSVIEYDPFYFDIDPELVAAVEATTTVHATAEGFPRLIRIDLSMDFGEAAAPGLWSIEYRVEAPPSGAIVEHPLDPWISVHEVVAVLDEPNGGPAPFFDLYLPATWDILDVGDGYLAMGPSDEEIVVVVADVRFREPATFNESLPMLFDELGYVDPTIDPVEVGGFPAVIATTNDPEFGQLYYTLIQGNPGITVVWSGSSGNTSDDRAVLEEILDTLEWTSSGGVVPGSSIGSAELQQDTLDLVTLVATTSHEGECDQSRVVHADVARGDDTSWTENWFVLSCGLLEVYPITFSRSSDGGTDIAVSPGRPSP